MRNPQPPITNAEEYRGYQMGRDKLTQLLEEREKRLMDALASGDSKRIEAMRFDLLQVLRDRQNILDAIQAYERKQQQSA
jgi:excinuclease UvrABC nuclease subunit